MDGFHWRGGTLYAEEVAIEEIVTAVGTPTYVYSTGLICSAWERLQGAFAAIEPRVHFAVKACPNLHVCRAIRDLGAGMDVVSGGELERAWLAGTPMSEVVFAGVGKSDAEVRAALDGRHSLLAPDFQHLATGSADERGPVGLFNIESQSELDRLTEIAAEVGQSARACVRINPDVDPKTHQFIATGRQENKFGIDVGEVLELFDSHAKSGDREAVQLVGLHVHIGSLVPKVAPYVETLRVVLHLAEELEARGHRLEVLDLGGGFPVDYGEGAPPDIAEYAAEMVPLLSDVVARGIEIVLEPGRYLVANAGVLVTRVEHRKEGRDRRFLICDAGMNALIRPALYGAFHFIWPVEWSGEAPRRNVDPGTGGKELELTDVVGPICETGDFLARGRALPPLARGDLIAVFGAGAYSMSMASNYNDHGRPAEVLVTGRQARVVAEREVWASRLSNEMEPRAIALGGKR